MSIKTNKAGFSLVELMVVVAIIGILATIAIPNFQKFQSRSKQSSAKAELTGIYTAEKAFFEAHDTYHSDLAYIGYQPDGWALDATGLCPDSFAAVSALPNPPQRHYIVGFTAADAAAVPGQAFSTNALCVGRNQYEDTLSGAGVSIGWGTMVVNGATGYAGVGTEVTVFTAGANGRLNRRSAGPDYDQWTINENKALVNTRSEL